MGQITEFELERFTKPEQAIKFDCGVDDLNEFLLEDALNYSENLLTATYLIKTKETKDTVLAYFSVLNDTLTDKGKRDWYYIFIKVINRIKIWTKWNWLNRKIPYNKRRKDYPAVKLGRLAVAVDYSGNKLGTEILDWMKDSFKNHNKTGCRFIVVDARNNDRVIKFYEDNDFILLTNADEGDKTRFMFFDLMRFKS